MLQVFLIDVAKVDQDAAYVAMVVHVCCKCLFSMFHLFFHMYVVRVFYLDVAYVSHICCKCFIWVLHMFHTSVTSILSGCCVCLQWFQVFLGVFCKCFRRMFYLFHPYSYVCCKCCI
jgi:hypothetical protein